MRRRLAGPAGFLVVAVLLLVVAPLVLSPFRLDLLSKYLCYAVVAIGIALAWGRGGMLTLGQGVFFGLGGYAMGMHLKLQEAGPGNLPDFMSWSGVEQLPLLWKPFANPVFALAMVVVLPVVVAVVLGLLIFRQRVRGAYFAVLSQALAAAFVILLVGQQGLTGGTNGLTNFQFFFGLDLYEDSDRRILYFAIVVVLGLSYLAVRQLVRSRWGQLLVAIRDGEDRVRFLGYDPALVKTGAFAVSAALAGIGGALFVPVVGLLTPANLGIVASLELLIGVAIGGRYSLAGAIGGTLLFNYAKTIFSESWPDSWLYVQGALFIAIMLWAPRGLAGLLGQARDLLARRRQPPGSIVGRDQDPGGGTRVSALLEVRNLNVVFSGFHAITDLDFTLDSGELRFLIGPNGAGKTTLIDVITGLTKPASGSVTFAGDDLAGKREYRIVRAGIGRTFQTSVVFEELTVLDNLDLAAGYRRKLPTMLRRRRGVAEQRRRLRRTAQGEAEDVASALDTIGLGDLADRPAGVLSHGQRQWLEIGMLIVQRPRLLLLDEPVAGMSRDERERTGALLQSVAKDHTVLVVEHDMAFLRRFASTVTVLHEGKLLCEGTVAQVQADPRVQEVYLGRTRDELSKEVA